MAETSFLDVGQLCSYLWSYVPQQVITMRNILRALYLLVLQGTGVFTFDFPDCTKPPLKGSDVCDTSLAAADRARSLIKQWTLQEKVDNVQNTAPGVPRLGIPAYEWWSEALHGVAESPGVWFAPKGDFSYATSFPGPILMGAAFDDELIEQVAAIISTEARAFSNANHAGLDFWTPNINPYKDPRWGRGQETPGEDPYHLQQYVGKLLSGLEGGSDPKYKKMVACCKHFAAYDLEEWNGVSRHTFNAQVALQDLSEYYLPSFQTCARDAKVGSIMCSYNAVNGEPACANKYLMQTILREHWGWNGDGQWVTGDCGAVEDIYKRHNYTDTPEEASAVALNTGTDTDCGTTYAALTGAHDQGLFKESTLDAALVRLYTSLVELGYFDPPENQPYRSLAWKDVGTDEAKQLARKAATEGIVLLKNDQKSGLPWKPSGQKIAVIGPMANATDQLKGNYFGVAEFFHSPVWAAKQLDWDVSYAFGTSMTSGSQDDVDAALSTAKEADAIIYVGGIDNSIESEGHDRTTIVWPDNQLDLISQLSKLDKPFTVVQLGGGQVDDSSLLSNDGVTSLLWAGYPGQDGGPAIFDIISGAVAPAGRLPVTQYPGDYVDKVPMTDMTLRPSDSNPGRTYRWYNDAVIEFGTGLHYTTFDVSFSKPRANNFKIKDLVSKAKSPKDKSIFASYAIDVKNTGDVTSDYVAMLFIKTKDAGPSPYPRKTLVSYARASAVKPGGSQKLELDVTLGSLARTDEKGNLVLYPGSYELQVDLDGPTLKFDVTGDESVLDEFPQP